MIQEWVLLLVSLCYLGILFGIASYGDFRADSGRSIISNPYIYTLSIAVYCTAWTFYGSVGRAVATGVGFLPIYLGPTVMAVLWWIVLRKIIRIAKSYRITSIADFIASRYGKSSLVGGLVTVIAVVGIMPYISLQLKAISTSFTIMHTYPAMVVPHTHVTTIWNDTAFAVAMVLAAFSILFGTRHIDVAERHEGMVAAIAFESVIKLLAFCSVGVFVTFGMFSGPGEIFSWADTSEEIRRIMTMDALPGGYAHWFTLSTLSMMAIMFLPRQFQVLVVENVNENHLRQASWLFPLYLLVINIFVLPIALAGKILFPEGGGEPDFYVLTLPLSEGRELLAMFVYLGGFSAATGMVIVATIALSTMVCNDLVMPVLLRLKSLAGRDLSRVLLAVRRVSIVFILFLGYLFYRYIGESYALVSIGLLSFAAAVQFAPAILLGIVWKGAGKKGAIAGLAGGFLVWAYTLLLPSFAKSGWLPHGFVDHGPWQLAFLKPYQLFGLDMFDPISHSLFWSMLVNIGLLVGVSLFSRHSTLERIQASLFVDVFSHNPATHMLERRAVVTELRGLVARFIGKKQAAAAFADYASARGIHLKPSMVADTGLIEYAERLLTGVIGAASARVMVSSVVEGEEISQEGIMQILDETSQVIEYSRRLEEKSQELQEATEELQRANIRLKELDRAKDEFVSTVSHELRTPLTSVRAFAEILQDNPEIETKERSRYLTIMVKESERLTRLINEVLDLAKIEAGRADWCMDDVDMVKAVRDAMASCTHLVSQRSVSVSCRIPERPVHVFADRDRIMQVLINLVSNALKFCDPENGQVSLTLREQSHEIEVAVSDNGPGIPLEEQTVIFEKFRQISSPQRGKPRGTGLGLTICRRIIEYHNGTIRVDSTPEKGAVFSFTLPK